MPSYVPAKRGTAYVTYVALIDQASGKLFKANPTLAAGDVKVSIDGGTFNNLTTLPTVTPAAGKQVKVDLSAAEMTGDLITVLFSDVAGAEWNDLFLKIETSARQLDELAFPTVPGRSIDVSPTGGVGIDWSNVEAPTSVVALTNTTVSSSQVVSSVTGAVGSVTGNVGGNVAGSVGSVAANGITAASLDPTAGAEIADAVWDEAISGHLAAGSTGAALNAAGSAGDPWTTPLPGAYGAGTAGNILGVRLDATVSSRATQTSVDAVKADTAAIKLKTDTLPASPASETTSLAIKAKTDNLPVDPADESNTQARFTTLDAAVAAVAAKTNNLPVDPADNSDILGAIAAIPPAPSALVVADTLLNRDMSAVSDTNSRSPLNAMRFLRNKWSAAAGVLTVTKENDATVAWTATLATDAAALPIIGSDPA
jgi:hypothetical protein